MKCNGENVVLRGTFHVVARFLYILCYIAEIWITFLTACCILYIFCCSKEFYYCSVTIVSYVTGDVAVLPVSLQQERLKSHGVEAPAI